MSNTKSKTNTKNKRKKKPTEEIVRKSLKHSAGFTWGLLVNVIIVYIVVKLFAYSFNFAYSVFGNVACDPSNKQYVVVEIPADSSTLDIATALEKKKVIDNKYVFAVKVKVKEYGNKITAGKYGLSPSMTYDEILDVICHIENEEDEDK